MARRLITVVATCALVVSAVPAAGAGTTPDTIEGEVQRLAVELYDGGGLELTLVVPDEGDAVQVRTEDLAEVETGSQVAVVLEDADEGQDDVLDPEGGATAVSVDVLAPPDTPPGTRTGELGMAITPGPRSVRTAIATIGAQASDGVTNANLSTAITTSVSPFWSDSTNGALTFVVNGTGSTGNYTGWGSTSTCTASQVHAFLTWSATLVGWNPTINNQRHSVTYAPNMAACWFGGVANVSDGGSAWINGFSPTAQWDIVAHELGHTLTLKHSNSRVSCVYNGANVPDGTSAQCWEGEYGDAYDLMGWDVYAGTAGPLGGAQLDALGLLPAGSVVATSSRTVTLAPVGGLTGTRFVKFVAGGATYYVEYRGAVGRDADLATTRSGCPGGLSYCEPDDRRRYTPGVVIHRRDSTALYQPVYLLDAIYGDPGWANWFVLPAGKTFTTADGVVSVSVTSVSAAGAVVALTMPERPFDQIVASRDFTGDARADVFTVDGAGKMFLFPGLGNGRLDRMRTMAAGWDGLKVYAPGDWNGGGASDLLATDAAGDLWLYPGNGAGALLPRIKAGYGWIGFRIVPAGDMNGDGKNDLLAMDSVGRLWLYPGAGGGLFGRRILVGNGWNGFELYAAGDMNGDRRADILSIDSLGKLWFYAGIGGGYFGTRVQLGQGWRGFVFASGADLNNDGYNDLLGRDSSGRLWFYAGRLGARFAAAVQVSADW